MFVHLYTKLVGYLHVHADKLRYNYYSTFNAIKSSAFTFILTAKDSSVNTCMASPHVHGDNSQASASRLSYVHVDKHGIFILYHLHQSMNLAKHKIFPA